MLSKDHLPNPQPNEQVVLLLRRHHVVFVLETFYIVLLFVLPIAIGLLVWNSFPHIFSDIQNSSPFFVFLVVMISMYYFSVWLLWYYFFIDYYLDVWIVTSARIINIEQTGFFHRVISEQKLFRVQDVTSEVIGIIPTFLNYGTVYIQTAGEKQRFTFKQVPFPYKVREKIIHLIEQYKHSHPQEME